MMTEDEELDALLADFEAFESGEEEEELSMEEQVALMRQSVIENEKESLHLIESPELEKTLQVLRDIRDVTIKDFMEVDKHGNERAIPITELPDNVAMGVSSIKMKINHRGRVGKGKPIYETLYDAEGEEVLVADQVVELEIKLWDKNAAVEKLMRYEGAYEKDNDQKKGAADEMMDVLVEMAGAGGLPTIAKNDA